MHQRLCHTGPSKRGGSNCHARCHTVHGAGASGSISYRSIAAATTSAPLHLERRATPASPQRCMRYQPHRTIAALLWCRFFRIRLYRGLCRTSVGTGRPDGVTSWPRAPTLPDTGSRLASPVHGAIIEWMGSRIALTYTAHNAGYGLPMWFCMMSARGGRLR